MFFLRSVLRQEEGEEGGFFSAADFPIIEAIQNVGEPPAEETRQRVSAAFGEEPGAATSITQGAGATRDQTAGTGIEAQTTMQQEFLDFQVPGNPPNLDLGGTETFQEVGTAAAGPSVTLKQTEVADDPRARMALALAAQQQINTRLAALDQKGADLATSADAWAAIRNHIGEFDDQSISMFEQMFDEQEAQLQQVQNQIAQARTRAVNPSQFFSNVGESAGFGAAMATAVGHLASALGGGPNEALRTIQKAVASNVRAQEAKIVQENFADQQQVTLFDRMQALTRSRLQARNLTRAMLLQQADFQFKELAQRAELNQIPHDKDAVSAQLQADAAKALLEYSKENKREWTIKAGSRAQALRQMRAAAPQSPSPQPAAPGVASDFAEGVSPTATASTGSGRRTNRNRRQRGQTMDTSTMTPQAGQQRLAAAVDRAQKDGRSVGGEVTTEAVTLQRELFELQRRQGRLTPGQAKDLYDSNVLLRTVFRDSEDLILPKSNETVKVSAGGQIFEFGVAADGAQEREKKITQFQESKGRISNLIRFNQTSTDVFRMLTGGQIAGTRIPFGRDNQGRKVLTLDNPQAREAAERIRQNLMFAVNIVREEFNGGALHGPGEWQIFAKMVSLPNEDLEGFINMFNGMGADAVAAAYAVTARRLQDSLDDTIVNIGLKSNKSVLRPTHEIEGFLESEAQ